MKTFAAAFFFGLFIGMPAGVMCEYWWPSSEGGIFRIRSTQGCVKCGFSEVKERYCREKCTTNTTAIDNDGKNRGGTVVWGYDHLHRICTTCGYERDAIECKDVPNK